MRQTHQKSEDKKGEGHTAHSWEKIAVFIFGVAFVVIMLSIAVFIPTPTKFQVFVFRAVLALAASGIGAFVPGFLHMEWKLKTNLCIRAGGAIALSLIVYRINPPALLSDTPGNIRANYIGHVKQNFGVIQYFGIPVDEFHKVSKQLGVTEAALKSFFKILELQQVPPEDLDSTLREIASRYKELQKNLAASPFDDQEIKDLKKEAQAALDAGDFDQAEKLLNDASNKGLQCGERLQESMNKCFLSAAESKARNGDLAWTQLNYKKAAAYYQEAVKLVPEGFEEILADYLQKLGDASYDAGDYRGGRNLR